ncbi:insulin-induced protein-domain-containing protein [Daldinia decipiens]|uniref:insulin-induced protein-domain-containing protein n=1 Tax=Daldinia decipiens TaxID=326647 RepID=UPI0020C553BD|nr:insulin-induced protein-domain-containing protein [Daldinia decipiens]KAI1654529.1 insulin-induced protein-domain-containing protein [Daldinia decipiens]
MSNPQGDDGPPLLRPIPRRPFNLIPREPTPPNDDLPAPIPSAGSGHVPLLNLESLNSRLLSMRNTGFTSESTTISRTDSALNLTGSTLAGIYSPSIWGKDKFYMGPDEPGTPWGTGAETPAKNLSMDEPNYEIQKERAQPARRQSSLRPVVRPQPLSTLQRVFYHGSRSLLLTGLGVLYGILAVQLRDRQIAAGALEAHNLLRSSDGSYDWRYMAFSGVCGIVMGSLLPWFDGVWERIFGSDDVVVESPVEQSVEDEAIKEPASFTDWALAIRGIGAFVGIAFAIRKLPWSSTLQVSLAFALVNPVLWYILDRSMSGLVLSISVGLAGSAMLLGLRPEVVPSPAAPSTPAYEAYGPEYGNATNGNATDFDQQQQLATVGGVSQETIAMGIWLWSVLFCCSICFGNIGRWLAIRRGATTKGRWAQRQ